MIIAGPANSLKLFQVNLTTYRMRKSHGKIGRLGTIAEIVSGVIFLASEESSYMTGGELVIDGGATSM